MPRRWWIRYLASLLLLTLAHLTYGGYFAGPPTYQREASLEEQREIVDWLSRVWLEQSMGKPPAVLERPALFWVDGFREGNQPFHYHAFREPVAQGLEKVFRDPGLQDCEAVEVGLATELLDFGQQEPARGEHGLWGLYLNCGSSQVLLTPFEFSRTRRNYVNSYKHYSQNRGVVKARKFRGLQWILLKDRVIPTRRGLPLVSLDEVPQRLEPATLALGRFEQAWVERSHGLFPYRYLVEEGRSSEQDRILVRNCLGSWSLANFARWTGQESDQNLAIKNLRVMVGRFGHRVGDLAYITDRDQAHLGSLAFIGLAILNLPEAPPDLREWEEAIARAVLASRLPSGHFHTTLALPGSPPLQNYDPEKDPNQDFFPGETLTYLATRAQRFPEGPWLKAFDEFLPVYQQRFRRKPHPAAVPWLAQACVQRYRCSPAGEAQNFAFEVIDWNLNNLQPWSEMDPFWRGAPIHPDHKLYGPYSATSGPGVQLEGLVEAWWLAREVKDLKRETRYREACLETARYLLQIQYHDPDLLYWLKPELRTQAMGGLRDLPWDHRIQSDSAAHALNAWLNMLRMLR